MRASVCVLGIMKQRAAAPLPPPPPSAVPTATECRAFFYGIFMDDLALRRHILRRWHAPYAPDPDEGGTGPPKRVADLWVCFIRDLLYAKVRFCMTHEYMLFWGDGARSLRIAYAWLGPEQRQFLVWRIYAHRYTLFKNIRDGQNGEFHIDGFVYEEQRISSHIWQRELVRDFLWFVVNKKKLGLVVELIAAIQALLWEHPRGQRDLFLLNLHDGLQNRCLLEEAPCWGLAAWDMHPDESADWEARQQMKAK